MERVGESREREKKEKERERVGRQERKRDRERAREREKQERESKAKQSAEHHTRTEKIYKRREFLLGKDSRCERNGTERQTEKRASWELFLVMIFFLRIPF